MRELLKWRVDDARSWISAMRNLHESLVGIIDGLEPGRLTGPSYCDDWTIAQVLSHLGSGAEIFLLMVEAGLAGAEPPSTEVFPPIWDAWNAKTPDRQAADCLAADEALLEAAEALDPQELDGFRISMFGMDLDAAHLLGMRVSEQTFHSWDVAVALDPSATLAADATALLIDELPPRVSRAGKPVGGPMRVRVVTTAPERSFVLAVDESVSLEELPASAAPESDGADGDTGKIELPAEALLRLVAGRLDDAHLPADLSITGVSLDTLRGVFPGF